MTTPFVDAADLMAQVCGMAGYAFAMIDHPVSSASSAALAERARSVATQAATLLGLTGN